MSIRLSNKAFSRNTSATLVFAVLVLSCFKPAFAAQYDKALSFKGFGTLGVSGTNVDSLTFRRDLAQKSGSTTSISYKPDSRIGFQVDYDLNESVHFGAQWVARNQAGDFLEQNLDWAFVRWRPTADVDIRAGRLGFDTFALSDFRNVGYTYSWMRPPHAYYTLFGPYHFDGADIRRRVRVKNGILNLKANFGSAYLELPNYTADLSKTRLLVGGGSASYEQGSWQARLGYQYSTLKSINIDPLIMGTLNNPQVNAIWPGAQNLSSKFENIGSVVQYSSLGLSYDNGLYMAQMEFAYIASDNSLYPGSTSGYLNIGRRFKKVTLYTLAGYGRTQDYQTTVSPLLVPVPEIAALRSGIDYALNNNGINQKSISVGARWDVLEKAALKLQLSHFKFGADGTALWSKRQPGNVPDEVFVWSLGLDFIF